MDTVSLVGTTIRPRSTRTDLLYRYGDTKEADHAAIFTCYATVILLVETDDLT